jgi:hypothetical protein
MIWWFVQKNARYCGVRSVKEPCAAVAIRPVELPEVALDPALLAMLGDFCTIMK